MILREFHALNALLVSRGWPDVSPWWLETIENFYGSAQRCLILRVGRRGGKSSTLCRIAVCEALWGQHEVPPGDVGVVAIVSTTRDEASQRLRTVCAILDEIEGVKYKATAGLVDISEPRPMQIKVFTATVKGVSGFTCICALCDEVAKWLDADTGANPATEVIASLVPTMITMPHSRIFLSSSAVGRLDAHAKAFDAGDNEYQLTAFAPTWLANPTISEADTFALEQNEDRRLREYGAVPMEGTGSSLLSVSLVDRCTRDLGGDLPRERGVFYVAAMDPAFVKNAWTFAIAALRYGRLGRLTRSIVLIREWRGSHAAPLNPETILKDIAGLCRAYDVPGVYTDQYEAFSLQAIGARVGLDVSSVSGNAAQRLARYDSLVTRMFDGEIEIPPDRQLRADLLSIRQKLTANGFTIDLPSTPDGRHADYAPSVTLALSKLAVDPLAPQPNRTAEWENEERERLMWEKAQKNAKARQRDGMRPILDAPQQVAVDALRYQRPPR